MSSLRLAESAIEAIDWSRLRSATGNGEGVRRALGRLLASDSAATTQEAYWGIENHAFVRGELFEVSEACSSILVASLADPRERWVRIAVLELLLQIMPGHASYTPDTPRDLDRRCREALREGLWLLFREVLTGERDAALDVLNQLGEGERARRLVIEQR